MLKLMVDYNVMFYVMGVVALAGVGCKIISQFTLKRLVRASSNMNKSTHKLMKLMRAKYEHACMVSDRVQNVSAFVDKYVYEYSILGLRLHTWQQMQKQTMWMSAVLGALGAGIYYHTYGMGEAVYRYAGIGAILMMLLFLLQLTTDEKYLLKTAEVYMIDYLENVCAHRYEKMYQKESAVQTEPESEKGMPEEIPLQEAKKAMAKGNPAGEKISPIQENFVKTEEKNIEPFRAVTEENAEEETNSAERENIIREILEEFLAQRT